MFIQFNETKNNTFAEYFEKVKLPAANVKYTNIKMFTLFDNDSFWVFSNHNGPQKHCLVQFCQKQSYHSQ